MIKINRKSILLPDYAADSVFDIDTVGLKKAGITHLVFDLDNTLLTGRVPNLTPETVACISKFQKAGFTVLLGSNTRRDIDAIAQSINAHRFRPRGFTFKPRLTYYRQLRSVADVPAKRIAMIGDHPVNDVIGPNRAGFTTVLVESLSKRKRNLNHFYLGWLKKYHLE